MSKAKSATDSSAPDFAAMSRLAAACAPQLAEKKKPTNDYQVAAANVAPPANLRSVCYNDADLTAFRVRMVQQLSLIHI